MGSFQTKGIVLNQKKYSESSIIINVLTEDHGKMSFIANGVRKNKSKLPASYFQAFNILQINYIKSTNSSLHRITEISTDSLLQNIIFDIQKSSICLFLAEFVNMSLQSQEQDKRFFIFLESIIQFIDQAKSEETLNIHLWTLIRLMQFNGINPESNYSDQFCYFNPVKGQFTNKPLENSLIYTKPFSRLFNDFLQCKIEDSYRISMTRTERQLLIEKVTDYFRIHLEGFRTTKSLEILTEVFN
jgi:DNA repair protein RecO (recombination protein O)